MSIKVMSCVWEHSQQKDAALLLLLAIADFANDNGQAFPGVPALAKKIRMSLRQTQRLLRGLVESGELTISPRSGFLEGAGGLQKSNLYTIALQGDDNLSPPSHQLPSSSRAKGGDISAQGGDIVVSPEPLLEPKDKDKGLYVHRRKAKTKTALIRQADETYFRSLKRPSPGVGRGPQTAPASRWIDRHAERQAEVSPLRPANLEGALPWMSDG